MDFTEFERRHEQEQKRAEDDATTTPAEVETTTALTIEIDNREDELIEALELMEKTVEVLDIVIEDNPYMLPEWMLKVLTDQRLDLFIFTDDYVISEKVED